MLTLHVAPVHHLTNDLALEVLPACSDGCIPHIATLNPKPFILHLS